MEYYIYDKYEIILQLCRRQFNGKLCHILIKTADKPLGQFIGRIGSEYAKYYDKKYNYIGHLFQDRYFSELIESDSQMFETSGYIHLNPVRAKMVEKPESYEWSTDSMYIGKEKEKLIYSDRLLSYFNNKNRELYERYVESAIIIEV